jgi:EAL domain-containing protein (putative c-di-GMP-specific phosphodiesterase class I)
MELAAELTQAPESDTLRADHAEYEATAALLAETGADYLQGYPIHRPEPLPH